MAVTKLQRVTKASRHVNSTMETLVFSRDDLNEWTIPPFQRQLRVNEKVRMLGEELKANGGIISGVITLGTLPNDKTLYLVDGQHRREAFRLSGLAEGLSDVRICKFDDMAHMAEAFVGLQQSLVSMRPDDILRGMEGTTRSLQIIRHTCPFVGYDAVRRNAEHAPFLSMTMVMRAWAGSRHETPHRSNNRETPLQLARQIDDLEVTNLCKFLHVAHSAWNRDVENARLWASLNLGLCMWLYRRIVLDEDRSGSRRAMVLTTDQFKKCLIALSADADYSDWLVARVLNDHSRAPCYRRVKAIWAQRLKTDKVTEAPKFPSPAWSA